MRCSTACLIGGSHLLAPTTALYFRRSLLAAPTCWLASSCPGGPPPVRGASTVGSEGVEVGTACGGAVATTLGFLAVLACRVATGGAEELLLGASAVGSEGVEGTTTGIGGRYHHSRHHSCLGGLALLQLDELATSHLFLMSTRSLQWRGLPSAVIRCDLVGSAEDWWGRML